jgi:hypothetical protein
MRLLANDSGAVKVAGGEVLNASNGLALGAVIPRPQPVRGAIPFQVSFAHATTLKCSNLWSSTIAGMRNNDEKSCNR